MSKSVVYTTCTRIACVGQSSPTVILCLDNDTLAASTRLTIEGTLTNVYKDNSSCNSSSWRYVVSYDEDLLTDPDTALTSADITGIFCKGCLTTWVEEEVDFLGGAFRYVMPTVLPTVGQVLTVTDVTDGVVTLEWA